MLCPKDETPLNRMVRQGVEIETCPACRGIWLDRGELEKLIALAVPPAVLEEPERDRNDVERPREKPAARAPKDREPRKKPRENRSKKRKKRLDLGDLLEEIFDFD